MKKLVFLLLGASLTSALAQTTPQPLSNPIETVYGPMKFIGCSPDGVRVRCDFSIAHNKDFADHIDEREFDFQFADEQGNKNANSGLSAMGHETAGNGFTEDFSVMAGMPIKISAWFDANPKKNIPYLFIKGKRYSNVPVAGGALTSPVKNGMVNLQFNGYNISASDCKPQGNDFVCSKTMISPAK